MFHCRHNQMQNSKMNADLYCLYAIWDLTLAKPLVIRILTSRSELARRLLDRHNISFSEVSVLAVELSQDKTLTNLCHTLRAAELSIYYAYPLLVWPRGLPVIALHTDDTLLSAQILRRKLFTLLAENDMGENATGSTPGMN